MTDVSLREYVERVIDEHTKQDILRHEAEGRYLQSLFTSYEKSLILAKEVIEQRLTKLNDFEKKSSAFVQRDVWEVEHGRVVADINRLEGFRNKALGLGILISLLSAIGGAAFLAIIHPLVTRTW